MIISSCCCGSGSSIKKMTWQKFAPIGAAAAIQKEILFFSSTKSRNFLVASMEIPSLVMIGNFKIKYCHCIIVWPTFKQKTEIFSNSLLNFGTICYCCLSLVHPLWLLTLDIIFNFAFVLSLFWKCCNTIKITPQAAVKEAAAVIEAAQVTAAAAGAVIAASW